MIMMSERDWPARETHATVRIDLSSLESAAAELKRALEDLVARRGSY